MTPPLGFSAFSAERRSSISYADRRSVSWLGSVGCATGSVRRRSDARRADDEGGTNMLQLGLRLPPPYAPPRCDHQWEPHEVHLGHQLPPVLFRCARCRSIGARQYEHEPVTPKRCGCCCCLEWGVNQSGRGVWCSRHTRAEARGKHTAGCGWRRWAAALHERCEDEDLAAAQKAGVTVLSPKLP